MLDDLASLAHTNDRRSQTLRNQIFESFTDCVKLLDLDGNLLFMNSKGQHLLGIEDFDELRSTPWTSLWPTVSHSAIRTALTNARINGLGHFEGYCPTRSGQCKWWDVTVSPVLDSEGKPEKLLAISRDVSELFNAKEQARASFARLQFGLNAAQIGHWDLDLSNDTSHRSLEHDRCFGYDRPLAQWGFRDALRHVHPEDRSHVTQQFEMAVSQLQNWSSEFRVIWPDRTVHWLALHGAIYYTDGKPVRMGGIVYDITQRKHSDIALRESEAKFRTIANAMPQMVWSTLPDGDHDYFNPQWYEYTGVPEGSTEGAGWNQLFHPEDQSRAWELWRHCLATGEIYEIQYRLRNRTGQYRWVLGRALPVLDDHGKVIRWMGTCTDIHDQKLAEESLKAENRRKDEFLAMLGHEIRNPLSAIRTAAAVISTEGNSNPHLSRVQKILERQSNNLSKIVDDLLDATRVSVGKVTLRMEPLDLGEVAASCMESLQTSGPAKGRQVAVQVEQVWVNADRTRLEQVINNLLINAFKYTPRGGAVTARVFQHENSAIFEVADSGIGIPKALLPSIFDLFVQAPSSLDRTQGGLGIGLTLVHQLTSLHGGSVEAQSEGPDRGSTFTVRLPLLHQQATPLPVASASIPFDIRKVLLIEDNADGREMMALALSSHGHEVLQAETGEEGIRLFGNESPTVAVIDIGLPGMNGLEIARHLRADSSYDAVRLIALTGYGQESDRRLALEAGFDEHLVKPVDIVELLRCVVESR